LKPNFLRYITGDAGHLERLYEAVSVAVDYPDIAALQREVLAERKTDSQKTKRFRGLKRPRSYEPHQALARELGILERGERWRITSSVGSAFLRLWKEGGVKSTKYLLLALFIKYDRIMIIPFLSKLLEGEKEPPEIVADVWDLMWKEFPREMELAEPPLPLSLRKEKNELKRTCSHHSLFRLRFLKSEEGLNLQDEQLSRIVKCFKNYSNPKFPSDYYSMIGYILTGKVPASCNLQCLNKETVSSFKIFSGGTYTSASAVFHYINGRMLPDKFIDWEEFLKFLKTSGHFNLHPSSSPDDVLFSIRGNK